MHEEPVHQTWSVSVCLWVAIPDALFTGRLGPQAPLADFVAIHIPWESKTIQRLVFRGPEFGNFLFFRTVNIWSLLLGYSYSEKHASIPRQRPHFTGDGEVINLKEVN